MLFLARTTVRTSLCWIVCLTLSLLPVGAFAADGLGTIFVIDMENHNLTQSGSVLSPQPLFGNPAAPYLNSLMTPGNPNAAQTAWAANYYSVGAAVHPSLPNYLWQEAGSGFGVTNDNMPFGPGGNNQGDAPNLTGLLQSKSTSWKSYQEDIDLDFNTNTVLPQSQWTVPLQNHSGTNTGYTNPYNGSHQYDYGTKHSGSLYFNATNGNGDPTTSNPEIPHYAPLQQFSLDLASNSVARYNLIVPDQFNDMHTTLTGGFTYQGTHYTGDAAQIAQGDNFLSTIIPQIMVSDAYQNNGAIFIWFDETEGGDSNSFTLPEIVISPLARGDAYSSTLRYTHSSDLKTLQELFNVPAAGQRFLGDADTAGTNDLSDLFLPGAVPQGFSAAPEPAALLLLLPGLFILRSLIPARNPCGSNLVRRNP